MPLKLYCDAASEFPDFTPGWSSNDNSVVFTNPRFGTILHVAVCDETGAPLYDQPVWSESTGAVIVPVNETGNIVFLENYRPVSPNDKAPGAHPPSAADLLQRGKFCLELPRGFAEEGESPEETAKRETEEEIGCRVIDVKVLGSTNTNSTFFLNNMSVWLAHVAYSQDPVKTPDKDENIRQIYFLDRTEVMDRVRSGDITCGITKAALLHYLAWIQFD